MNKSCAGRDDTLPTVEEIQYPKNEGGLYEEINDDTETSGVVTFHPKYREKVKRFAEIEKRKIRKLKKDVGYLSLL